MPTIQNHETTGQFESPGGHVFGIQGWSWGEQRPSGITFFLDGTTKVTDQHGRPIPGVVKDGRAYYFSKSSHQEAIKLLTEEGVDWRTLVSAGWPQLPYEKLKELKVTPATPLDDLRKIKDDTLRRDALKYRRELDEMLAQEGRASEDE